MPDSLNFIWEDNSTDSIRNDLTAGTHFVTITDPTHPDCPNVIEVIVEEENPLDANLMVNQAPDCGEANGSATIVVTGGSGNYTFSWDGGTDTGINLASGFYSVTIADTDVTMCELVYEFVLLDNVPGANITLNNITGASCIGGVNGTYFYTLELNDPDDPRIFQGYLEISR